MPVIQRSSYPRPPLYQYNGHLQTVMPALLRRVHVRYERERLELPDGDFLDLDWIDRGSRLLVVLSHGLEGNTQRNYIKGAARLFARRGWDVLAWNCRSCSGEINRALRMYHHGDIDDLTQVVLHALRLKHYEAVVLVGFSMGGSMTLKYLGVNGAHAPEPVKAGIAFSTPCDLKASVEALEAPENRFYKQRFFRSLSRKIMLKAEQFPGAIDPSKLNDIQMWKDFDESYSAPISGFSSADAFYEQSSAIAYLGGIARPVLLVNAQNDPLLKPSCSPAHIAERHPHFYLETPRLGGHVGFSLPRRHHTWAEYRALEFAEFGIGAAH
jgi:predicted alpha/beta-fold hydrolase